MESIEHIQNIPALGISDIHIWGAEVPRFVEKFQSLGKLLCPEEQDKAARFKRIADRNSSVVSRGALRILLSAYSDIPAVELIFNYSENGKPHCPDSGISFNVSHSGDWVVLAFGRHRQVGVDVERVRRDLDIMKIAERYFSAEETKRIKSADDPHQAFFHHWARKEAYVKAAGSALFRELSTFSVPYDDGVKDDWFFHRLEAGSNYASAVVSDKAIGNVPCYDFGGLKWDN